MKRFPQFALANAPVLSAALPISVGVIAPLVSALMQLGKRDNAGSPAPSPTPKLFSGARWFEPGQTGVTFESLFGKHLAEESKITVFDPHVKTFRQIRIFGEFLDSLHPTPGSMVEVRLVTSRATGGFDWEWGQAQALMALKVRAESLGIRLSVSFDENIHDRWIESSAWTILLGKGLDLWRAGDCASTPQIDRAISKKFAITYIRSPKEKPPAGHTHKFAEGQHD